MEECRDYGYVRGAIVVNMKIAAATAGGRDCQLRVLLLLLLLLLRAAAQGVVRWLRERMRSDRGTHNDNRTGWTTRTAQTDHRQPDTARTVKLE